MTQKEYDEACKQMDEDFQKVNGPDVECVESAGYFLNHYQIPEGIGMTYEAAFYTYIGFMVENEGVGFYQTSKNTFDGKKLLFDLMSDKHKEVPAEVFEFKEED